MTIPPFPSQDLAKLVLGYLAEEQLMTAYDEFLQASPYLDALGNEYDRIFMTSLKNILAEYRAVKIFVETCKPFILRKKIFQCSNLLEMVRFLVQNVDINKLQIQENNNIIKHSLEKQSSHTLVNTSNCDVCSSLKLDVCTCKTKNNVSSVPCNTHSSTSNVENSVETTPLSDLPGNHVTCRKKSTRVINKDLSESNVTNDPIENSSKLLVNNEVLQKSLTSSGNENVLQTRIYPDAPQNIVVLEKPDSLEMRQKGDINSILKQICNKNKHVISQFEDVDKKTKASMTGYDDFATGVNSGGSGASVSVPDSSTSENILVQIPAAKETNKLINLENTKITKTQYLLKVANVKNNLAIQPNEVVSISTLNSCTLPRMKPKSDESKIKILSDIKVDNTFTNNESLGMKIPAVLKNATSTPLLQMQTIVINGTPVYKHKPFGQKHNYTKDEIMAMPTIILAPAPGSQTECQPAKGNQHGAETATTNSARPLGPLVIDVSSSNNTNCNNVTNVSNQNLQEQKQVHILSPAKETQEELFNKGAGAKAADITSASAPKDATITGTAETSTPQVLPPLRKSSSTPRRTSHVRVLDFTTPRRILHETMNKLGPHMPLDSNNEVILTKSPSVPLTIHTENVNNKLDESKVKTLKESSAKKIAKNWDADLRVLATVPERDNTDLPLSPKSKPKPKSAKKTKAQKSQSNKKLGKSGGDKVANKKKPPKFKLPKNKVLEEDIEIITIPDEKGDTPVKPTINIITGVDRNPNTSSEINKSQNKSNNDDNIDTPEMERISLQNEIGVKLNISDLLETPYKQALYDIQMETPRFLGPDIPDDPMSDIKIMNIPTPRFLNAAATPSSYSSRPTDYSSGGSYYKPEDQDYMRVHDDLDCPVTSSKESMANELSSNKDSDDSKEKENMRPTRPVRECTKNVSYNLANMSSTRAKNTDNRGDRDSSVDSTGDRTIEKVFTNTPVTPKIKENKTKTDVNKKGSVKKRKTPVKKDMTKSFMKIKPRRPTPTKNNVRGKRKSIDPASQSKVQTRKKANTKEGSVNATPIVNPVPTKSRRKSSTPRKLHCTKSFHSESSGHDLPEFVHKIKENLPESAMVNTQDSDTEQLPLRWSDDGSQEPQPVVISIPNETEDIKKIKEYIETTIDSGRDNKEVSLHIDLVKRGFDLETAKIIERDLLDTPPHTRQDSLLPEQIILTTTDTTTSANEKVIEAEEDKKVHDATAEKTQDSDCSITNKLQIEQNDDEEDDEEIELSVHDCNEESTNYFTYTYDDSKGTPKTELSKLRDKFCMEVCIDDGVSIRLRATPFSVVVDHDPQTVEYLNYSYRETEMAVSSISNYEKLYTPLKESVKAQCYEIFDSTLTSLDTPLKVRSPKKTETEVSVTEIVLEVEKVDEKEKIETKKRKRLQSGNVSDESATETKRAKQEAQLLFNSTNIQNFDIDSVLSKLHGP